MPSRTGATASRSRGSSTRSRSSLAAMRYRSRGLRGLAADKSISDTFGGRVWEWLHPGQRAAEYDLSSGAGRTVTPPGGDVTFGDVLDTAAQNTLEAARAAGDYGREGHVAAG